VAEPEAVLEDQAAQLRRLIDDIGREYPVNQNVSTGEFERDCSDSSADGDWPRRWRNGRRLSTEEGQAISLAERIATAFSASGWSRRDGAEPTDRAGLVLEKNGFVLILNASDTGVAGGGGAIALIAYSPCVNADGTLDRRAVS
jgi:hypothetical protein